MASTIKVDNIQNQCGGAVVTKCGATTTISGSVVKANNIQAADGGNLVSQSGTTITLGASGDTISLAAGASQTGFGRTGTVDWDTTAKTASFTAVSGTGYFVDTSGGAVTMTLPASPSAGDIVAVADYTRTFGTNNLTIGRNSQPIGGVTENAVLSVSGQSATFIYVDGTEGWINTQETQTSQTGLSPFILATGGTITTCGDYKIHTFTSPGTFCVTNGGSPAGSNTVDYLVVAGGGGGGGLNVGGGGGGAGGYRESSGAASGCYSASPLGSGVSALPVSAQAYPITVGAGGASQDQSPVINPTTASVKYPGSNSIFSTITSAGGGGGGNYGGGPPVGIPQTVIKGDNGGAGGGGGALCNGGPANPTGNLTCTVGTGNTPPVSPPQGQNGGYGVQAYYYAAAGGGGAGAGGGNAAGGPTDPSSVGGAGGNGVASSITGSPVTRAGGGGGGAWNEGAGGAGGGGAGTDQCSSQATNGTANTGGGGGGGALSPSPTAGPSGTGGSGIVIIRYKYQ